MPATYGMGRPYIIVTGRPSAEGLDTMARDVSLLMSEGYDPCGGISAAGTGLIAQAMIRRDAENPTRDDRFPS